MSLLEKASGGGKAKRLPPQAGTSLFRRAIAASNTGSSKSSPPAEAESAIPAKTDSHHAELPASLDIETLDDLEERISALQPSPDALLAMWSLLSASLPLEAIALFLPHGDFLARAAGIGFPAGSADDIPPSMAPDSGINGTLIGDEAKALVAPSLGVGLEIDMRAASIFAGTALSGLWIYHDFSVEASPEPIRVKLSELLTEAAASFPPIPIADSIKDPSKLLLSRMAKYRFATVLRYDIRAAYTGSEAFKGLSLDSIRSVYVSSSEKLLDQTGTAFAFGAASVACILGSSSECDPELALFQFTKTLKRSLPFLAAEAFPASSAQCFDLGSDGASEGLSRFLST
jgi:hypothetical protein